MISRSHPRTTHSTASSNLASSVHSLDCCTSWRRSFTVCVSRRAASHCAALAPCLTASPRQNTVGPVTGVTSSSDNLAVDSGLLVSVASFVAAALAALFAYPAWRERVQRGRRLPELIVLPVDAQGLPEASGVAVTLLAKNMGLSEARHWRVSIGAHSATARLEAWGGDALGSLAEESSVRHFPPMHEIEWQSRTESDVIAPDHDRILRLVVYPTHEGATLRLFIGSDRMVDRHERLTVHRRGEAHLVDDLACGSPERSAT